MVYIRCINLNTKRIKTNTMTPLQEHLKSLKPQEQRATIALIKLKCGWNRQKLWRIRHGKQQPSVAERTLINHLLETKVYTL